MLETREADIAGMAVDLHRVKSADLVKFCATLAASCAVDAEQAEMNPFSPSTVATAIQHLNANLSVTALTIGEVARRLAAAGI